MENDVVLFRGKMLDTGDWVYGYFVETIKPMYKAIIIESIDIDISEEATDILSFDIHEVDAKTVGGYTGLKDKSGKRVFKGDILADFETGNNYVVEYDNETMCYELINMDESKADKLSGADILVCWNIYEKEFELDVIGSIYDKEGKRGQAI